MNALIGTVIHGYEIQEYLGEGRLGAVYRAHQTALGRDVALKIIRSEIADDPDFIRRFKADAQRLARLEHPGIVPLMDYWRSPGSAYLVMRFFRKGTLRAALAERPYSIAAAAQMLDQIAGALHAAHRSESLHQNIKPENILLDEDSNSYLADFTLGDAAADLMYAAPEQVRGDAPSPLSDLYSLGIVVYEVLTGKHPAAERLTGEQRTLVLPRITALSPGISEAVRAVLQKAVDESPARRYGDVLAFAAAFREAAGLHRARPGNDVTELLTLREHDVLRLIVEGRSNPEIAQELFVTVATVKWYVKQIYGKLRVRSRVQAIVRARELHLISRVPAVLAVPPHHSAPGVTITPEPKNPYKGLRAFESADNRDFFGREALVSDLVRRMADAPRVPCDDARSAADPSFARLLTIVGSSGSGKSSLVKAGLIPALWRGALPGSECWFVVEMMPGERPMDALEVALTQESGNRVSLHTPLEHDRNGLVEAARLLLPDDDSELVLVVDQFEELFTLTREEALRQQFLNTLVAAVNDPCSRVRVVITLRADFYDYPLHYPAFAEMVRARMVTILPLTADELERAIARPAEQAGAVFEPGLVAAIIADVNAQPGALPLLQYALTELFDQCRGTLLTHSAYHGIGGAVGALAKQAEERYTELDEAGKAAVRQMFLRLVTLGEGVEDTRRRVPRRELIGISPDDDRMDDLLDSYADSRLLSLDHDPATRTPVVEVAHEALIRVWSRLGDWLRESRDDLRLERQLLEAATDWQTQHQDPSYLATGARLTQFAALAVANTVALSKDEHAYLDAALLQRQQREREREAQQNQVLRLQRRITGILGVSLVTALILSGFAFLSRNEALTEARSAQSRQFAAQALGELQNPVGNDEFAALLAIRSLNIQYDPVADGALVEAAKRLPVRGFQGHTDTVYSVAYSPDGRYIVTGSADRTARLWDAASGEEIRTFTGHTGEVLAVAFSPDGRHVLTGSGDDTATLWNVETGAAFRTFTGHAEDVWGVAFSPDGTTVWTAGFDQTARGWSIDTGLQTHLLSAPSLGQTIAVSPDGRQVATNGEGTIIHLWDADTETLVNTLHGHTNGVFSLAYSPDGRYLLSGSIDNTARLWDVTTGETVITLAGHSSSVRAVAFSHDQRFIVTASGDRTARLWDAETGEELHQFRAHLARLWSVAFSPDDRYVLTGSADSTVKLWAVNGDSTARTFAGHAGEVYSVAYSPDGMLAATGSADATINLWRITTGELVRTLRGHSDLVFDLAFSSDSTRLVSGSTDDSLKVWDVETGEALQTLTGHTSDVFGAAYSPDGRYILSASADKTAILWDAGTGAQVRTFVGHEDEVYGTAFSPDGSQIATSSADWTANVWDVATGALLSTVRVPDSNLYGVVFSQDGKRIWTSGDDRLVRLWELSTGAVVRVYTGSDNTVYNIALSPDGQYLVGSSADRTATIWETATGKLARVLRGHESAVWDATFSPDGLSVLTGSFDGTAMLWETDYHDFVQSVCARLTRDFTDQERAEAPIPDADATCREAGISTS